MSLAASATAKVPCTRERLKDAVDKYLFMQWSGHHSDFDNLAYDLVYLENNKTATILFDIPAHPLELHFNRSILDTGNCKTFTELVATNVMVDPPHPYVIATQMHLNEDGEVNLIDSYVTDQGDWAFNQTGFLYWNSLENWDPLPEDKRDSREVLKAAADAYPSRFSNANISVPFNTPCARLEGGAYTGRGNLTANTCNIGGLPSNVIMDNRRYVIDEVYGAVDIFMGFHGLDRTRPNEGTPDSHFFRVEGGKIRYIHTVSPCFVDGCGMNGTGIPPLRL
ncbi:hypothetical protein K469DRAFT_728019 [Zopfia rhizophila CBS 207.26]|uniref:DUF8021 domain-containing protein n=1 Tax=Zopfia rhizophila CBS 207.26 TaxID=1314779 RepID=A0A6A6DZ59_9PEZI|nr:hypothetical protein K469DRAFT_728019 [Zopfia rhizophila CBS 207.26]